LSRVVAIGDNRRLGGFALVGVSVVSAVGADAVRSAWETLPDDAGLVIFTPDAAEHLGTRLAERSHVVWVVLPE